MFEFLYYVYNWWYYIPLDTVADDFVGVWGDDACDTTEYESNYIPVKFLPFHMILKIPKK